MPYPVRLALPDAQVVRPTWQLTPNQANSTEPLLSVLSENPACFSYDLRSADELDAVKRPLKVTDVKADELGRPSQRFVGRKTEVAVNPETGQTPSVNPTSTKKAQRLFRQLELEQ